MERRTFLKTLGGAVSASALSAEAMQAVGQSGSRDGEMARRVLGRTGEKVSVVGFPGLGLIQGDQKEGTEALHAAFDQGINHFDVAPAYGKGDAEIKMGIGLQGISRDKIFLSCKTKMRDKASRWTSAAMIDSPDSSRISENATHHQEVTTFASNPDYSRRVCGVRLSALWCVPQANSR